MVGRLAAAFVSYARIAWWGLVAPRTPLERSALVVVQSVVLRAGEDDVPEVLLAVRSDLIGWELPGGTPEVRTLTYQDLDGLRDSLLELGLDAGSLVFRLDELDDAQAERAYRLWDTASLEQGYIASRRQLRGGSMTSCRSPVFYTRGRR